MTYTTEQRDALHNRLAEYRQFIAAIAPTWALLPWDFAANVYFGEVVIQPDRNDQRWLL